MHDNDDISGSHGSRTEEAAHRHSRPRVPSVLEDAWQVAGEWVTHSERELRRHKKLTDVRNVTRRALTPLILFSIHSCGGRASKSFVYGLTFGLEEEINDDDVVDDEGYVSPRSLLSAVVMYLSTVPSADEGLGDGSEPLMESAEDLIRSLLNLETGERTRLWQAIRGVTRPQTAPRIDSSGTQFQSSLDEPVTVSHPGQGRSMADLAQELESLTGLASVKSLIRTQATALANDVERAQLGLSVPDVSRHLVLTGNPGTGKTTLARLITAIYHKAGIVPEGHIVETDRSGLVGEFLGHSAQKTLKMVEAARGGVLFVDEAYALAGDPHDGADRFALEALATLVKAMEDDRDDLVVILAGYPEEMNRLLEVNPGLVSRIGATINFPDYSDSELVTILSHMLAAYDYEAPILLSDRVEEWLRSVPRGRQFGNARLMRNLFESIKSAHAVRVQQLADRTFLDQRTVSDRDVQTAIESLSTVALSRPSAGFVDLTRR